MTGPGPASSPRVEDIRALAAQRSWVELARAMEGVDESGLRRVPELGVHQADALWRVGQAERAAELARRLQPVLQELGERDLVLHITNILGISLFELGEVDEAARVFADLLEMADEAEDFDFSARASNNLGVHASVQDRYDLALVYYERALASYIRFGQVRGIAQTHYNLGVNYRELGFFDKAESHYRLAVSYAERSGSDDVIGLAESDRGLLQVQMGDPHLGRVFAERARARFRAMGDPVREGEALRVLGASAVGAGMFEEAAGCFEEALAIGVRHGNRLLQADVQLERGKMLRERGQLGQAREALEEAARHFDGLGAAAEAEQARALILELAPVREP